MRHLRWYPILVVVVVVAAPVAASAQDMSSACRALKSEFTDGFEIPPRPVPSCRLDQGCLRVDWNVVREQNLDAALKLFRFTEKTPLRIQTENFNYIVYRVKWSKTVERQDKAFEAVTGLFDKVFPILSLFGGGRTAGITPADDEKLIEWFRNVELAALCLSETLAEHTGIVLDRSGAAKRERLHSAQSILAHAMPRLATLRLEYLQLISAPTEKQIANYTELSKRHADVEQRVSQFLPLAKASVEGVESAMGTEKRNSIVALTGQAYNRSSDDPVGEAVVGRYFVATSRPLIYHVGYGYGRLRDFDFKQVRTQAGQDLFAATTPEDSAAPTTAEESSSMEATAFMTWEFAHRGPNDRIGIGLTFGTGLESPGQSAYFGGTARVFGRLLVTAGGVTASATRGEGPVTDTTAADATRTLFASLRKQAATKFFWSISFRLY